MELSIGENIRRLRRERDMTQEQLAELLNITCGAVSKWERAESCPDIGMVIPLARVFGVSTDELMGYDTEKTAQEVKNIISSYNSLHINGRYDEADRLIFDARKTYPNDYDIMCRYMWVISKSRQSIRADKLNENCEELYKICDAILNGCNNEQIRLEAILMKAKLEQAAGRTDAAKRIIDEFPKLDQSAELKMEELFTKGSPEYLFCSKNGLYRLAQHLGFHLVRSVWYSADIDSAQRVRRIEAYGDELANMGEKFGETAFYMIEWAVFSHLNLQLIISNGKFDDILRMTEKELKAIVKIESAAKTDALVRECITNSQRNAAMLSHVVERFKSAEQKQLSELRKHPEFMALLEKYS